MSGGEKMSAIIKRICVILLIFLLFSLVSGCRADASKDIVELEKKEYQNYDKVASQILPDYSVNYHQYASLYTLKKGSVVETFNILADSVLKTDESKHWYPQYLATVVIAVNKNYINTQINGWQDLLKSDMTVGINEDDIEFYMSAMSYGLEGESYTLSKASALLKTLYKENRLKLNNMKTSVVICFDYQAAAMIKSGISMEIIVPEEGTFTFEKGLLSPEQLNFSGETDSLLIDAGFRLINGQSDQNIYPGEGQYKKAFRPNDSEHLKNVFESVGRIFRRDVLNSRLYTSADGMEHHFMVLFFTVFAIIWTGYVLHRIMQKKVRRAAILNSIFMIGWVLVRCFKWQVSYSILNRYCWYSYYLFQLGLPIILIWMSWMIDKKDDVISSPKWWRSCVILNSILFLSVITNDLHMLVFKMDLNTINAENNYTYGFMYYIIIAAIFIEVLIAFTILVQKNWKSPRKAGFLFPLIFCGLIVLYCIGYAMRIPIIVQSDMAIITCVVILLFIETCIRTGLIPINTKYKNLFRASTLKMQIINTEGKTILLSSNATPLNQEILTSLNKEHKKHQTLKDNNLYYIDSVTGGSVVWQEDISNINQMKSEIKESIAKLKTVNAMLEKEENIKNKLELIEARTELFSKLDSEIKEKVKKLSYLIETLPENKEQQLQMTRIILLLCYIKRCCNLFFRRKEDAIVSSKELTVYLDELIEFAGFIKIKIHVTIADNYNLPTRQAALFYDFLYAVLEWSINKNCNTLLVNIISREDKFIMSVLPAIRADDFKPDQAFLNEIKKENGILSIKDLEETTGIKLSFPKKEEFI